MTIRANTCPYCGAAYTLAAGGCHARCTTTEILKRLIALVAEADERRDPRLGEP